MLLEITSRCEPSCADCQPARDDAGDLDLEVLRDVLPALRPLGISTLALIGGEPILHPRFDELLELLCRAGYRLGLRTHGWHVPEYLEKLAPYRAQISYVFLALPSHAAREREPGSPVAGDLTRIMDAIDAYRAARHAVTVDHVVDRQTLDKLVALGERLADKAVTLNLRAAVSARPDPAPWHGIPEVRSILIPQIQALKKILSERIALEPSLGVNHTYSFCSNFALMDRALLRANGDVVFCHVCRADDRSGDLGNIRDEKPSAILARHPRRVGAILSARLAVMAAEPPAITNNCTFCQGILRSTAAPPSTAQK